jgi:membrane AbrB-like protein
VTEPGQAGRPRWLPWTALLLLSAILVPALELLQLPAALMLGPMIAAILVAASAGTVSVPRSPFLLAQGVIGCLMARGIPLSALDEILCDWPLFLTVVLAVIAASSALGWMLTRWQVLPGTTAIWGSSPGAASVMTLMSESYGADMRLVAFMQYLRLVLVAIAASVISSIWAAEPVAPAHTIVWFPPIHWVPFLATLALACLGALATRIHWFPAGTLMVPLVVGVVLEAAGVLTIELPPWLLAVTYAIIGWSIGLRFTRPILAHAARALPAVAAAILGLIAICGGLAAILVVAAGIDPLTAYLATSPGGVDSVAIIAASSHVDQSFVMAMQTVRFVLVLVIGPWLARVVTRHAMRRYLRRRKEPPR